MNGQNNNPIDPKINSVNATNNNPIDQKVNSVNTTNNNQSITIDPNTSSVSITESVNNQIVAPTDNNQADVNNSATTINNNIKNIPISNKNTNRKKKSLSPAKLKELEEKKAKLNETLASGNIVRSETPITFQCILKDPNGEITENNEIISDSILEVHTYFVNRGYEVYDIKPQKAKAAAAGGRKLPTKDLLFLLTQLATYLKAGITLADAVDILGRQMSKDKNKARIFQSLSYELTMGESFSTALDKQGNVFPQLLINMIRAAEATGEIIETLDDMANYYTEINRTNKQMKSAMTYPAIISVVATGVLTFIMIWVIPQFIEIYSQAGVAPTGMTSVVIWLSAFLKKYIIVIILIIAAIILTIYLLYKHSYGFRRGMQTFLMKTPVIKNVIIYNEMTIFTKTFASLLRNQVDISDSMNILEKITGNEIYKEIMRNTINNIKRGEKISDSFKDHWAIPDVAYYMLVTGESTGELPSMLLKVSDYFNEQHRNTVNSLKTFIEPITIAVLAFVVGFILIAVIVPMFSLYDSIE